MLRPEVRRWTSRRKRGTGQVSHPDSIPFGGQATHLHQTGSNLKFIGDHIDVNYMLTNLQRSSDGFCRIAPSRTNLNITDPATDKLRPRWLISNVNRRPPSVVFDEPPVVLIISRILERIHPRTEVKPKRLTVSSRIESHRAICLSRQL